MLFVTLFKGLISRGPLALKVSLLLIGCCLVSSFVQNPLQFQRGGFVTFFSLWKLTFSKFVVGFPEFWNSLHKNHNKSEETHNKLQKCQFSDWKKVTNPPLLNWKGVLHKTWHKAIANQKQAYLQVQGSPWNQTFEESYQKHYSSLRPIWKSCIY